MIQLVSREEYHRNKKKRVLDKEICPFCGPSRDPESYTGWSSEYWDMFINKSPYSGQANHLMAVPKRHVAFVHELTKEELADMRAVYEYVGEFYGDQDYFSCTRETMANRSVEHYHVHFMPGKLQGKYLRYMLMHQGFPVDEDLDT